MQRDLLNRQQFVLDELITWFQENYDEEQMEERIHEQNVTMAQSNWNPNMQTQNSYRNQGSQSREAPVQNVSWNRGTQEMPWDGNRFFITDLNSTNGTFRNGMRLEPNASEIIKPGDEIGIGKLKFIYR